ncbi:MAG: hypothetical protein A3I12_01550 [Gammaproteobacteria bacterium RIFCSPLOWO2_02_FULL_38_11]|nr:MAG: hypothetical protein A2W47_04485 [Gammaproteobacteria bacterium RIFCSPHIGHO2_12_38_15]OGT68993.1 MAG: hypothetical protein A3I12_01550 [Gammaproteobacteria bacterium RIFCSPLOWO2_02_FULL_38_11]
MKCHCEKNTPLVSKRREIFLVFFAAIQSSSYLIAGWIASKMRESSYFFRSNRTHFFAMTVYQVEDLPKVSCAKHNVTLSHFY